ncbi:MAG: substrate binding domain-containing protein, partial [Pseudomonadota bacterium]
DISGLLRVIAPVALGQGRLVDLAARLVRRHPGLRFDWMLTDRALDPVAEGADCVIRAGAISEPDLIARPLAEIRRVLVASPELARDDPAEIDGLPGLASRPFHGALIPLIDGQGTPRPLATEIVFASDNILAVHRAALMGLGVALLPQWMVEADLGAGRLARLAPGLEGKPLTISLGYPAGRHRPARLTAFIEALREDLSAAQGFARPPA